MGHGTLQCALTVLVLFYLMDFCDATNVYRAPNCTTRVSKTVRTIYARPISKRCPKNTDCNKEELQKFKAKHNTKTQRCCVNVKKEYVYKNTCCSGYEWVEDKKLCTPICKTCEGGTCTAPEICECERPLILQDFKCVTPICDPPCINGLCVDNDTCECNPGYRENNATLCVKQCDPGYDNDPITLMCNPICDNPCENGTCVAPNTCDCLGGYTKVSQYSCSPTCSPACENSMCVAPNECLCWDGFKNDNATNCSPICDSCDHGDCIAPNVCSCHDGYTKRNGTCTPVCDQPCVNGVCIEPNICECDSNYIKDTENQFTCVPFCETECINATCTSPNTCSCLPGYEASENSHSCKPKCEDCLNGDCVEPNKCSCHVGYVMTDGKCKPHCEKSCANGTCIKPNTCSCYDGYKVDEIDIFTCNPVCTKTCINARCDSPNHCSCHDGYVTSGDDSVCKPSCSSCVNGECVEPEVCRCFDGYTMTNKTCTPVCSQACTNGECTSPNTCTCNEGYEKDETDPTICMKPCSGPCDNGKCTLDGQCICNTDYELKNGTCVYNPLLCSDCEHSCVDGDCHCEDGKHCIVQPQAADVASTTTTAGLAGLELTWISAGAAILLLFVLVAVVMQRLYTKRQKTTCEVEECNPYGSVVYTVADTLIKRNGDLDDVHELEETEIPQIEESEPLNANDDDDDHSVIDERV